MIVILGAGLAGLSCSFHLGHGNCRLLEAKPHAGGHIHTRLLNGYTWDEGPHVSFTNNSYVRALFSQAVDGQFEEFRVDTLNYFKGDWIDHPAQSNLYQIPQPLRDACIRDFLAAASDADSGPAANYEEWLERAFGRTFATTFPAAYTRKYWTVAPKDLTTAWIGPRVFRPKREEILVSAERGLPEQTHYIKRVRYPTHGGYQAFAGSLLQGARVQYNTNVAKIDLSQRAITSVDGSITRYDHLINTLPLPVFISCCPAAPPAVKDAAQALSCSQLLLVNVTAPHPTRRPGHWFYVYDEDKYSTRIHCTETLSKNNTPPHHTAVQVEVYAGRFRSFPESPEQIAAKVVSELVEMGFIEQRAVANGQVTVHTHHVPWANVIFDHAREAALHTIQHWLESWGLKREDDDLSPTTDWTRAESRTLGSLILAGRFGQWKYFWTDDCVLRGRQIAAALTK